MDASEYRGAIRRLHNFRSLYERLYASEDAVENSFSSDWNSQQEKTKLRNLRRELVRAGPELHGDLMRPGTRAELLGLVDAPVLGGRTHFVPLIQAIVDGSARSYHVSPMQLDPTLEAVIAWHERMLAQVEEAEETDRRKAVEREQRGARKAAEQRHTERPRDERNGQRDWAATILKPVRYVLGLWSDLISVASWFFRHWPF